MRTQRTNKSRSAARLAGLCLLVAFVSLVILPSTGHAQGRHYREEWKLPDWYPRGFDGYGIINRISDKVVVVSDSSFKLSAGVTYNTPGYESASVSSFSAGRTAAYLLNAAGEIESLWLIE